MDFQLTEEQVAFQTMAREFAEREIKPVATALEQNPDATKIFPHELVRKGSKLGLRTLALPKEYGGQAIDIVTQTVMIDEMAFIDSGCAKIFSQCWKLSGLIATAGTKEQCDRFLIPFRDDDTFLMSIGMTEPDSGSDNILPLEDSRGGIKTSARRDGNWYILNGAKQFISLSNEAKLFLVIGRTDRTVAAIPRGASMFLVPRGTPGLSVGQIQDKLGWRLYTNAEVSLDNARIPKENLLGEKEGLMHVYQPVLGQGSIEMAAHILAVARAAYEAALSYAKQRVQGGKPIIQHQAVAIMLAEMFVDLQAGRTLLWRTAWLSDQGKADPLLCIACHMLAQDVALRISTQAVEIHGGTGVMKGIAVEKYVRDAVTFLHGGGTRQVNRLKIAKLLAS